MRHTDVFCKVGSGKSRFISTQLLDPPIEEIAPLSPVAVEELRVSGEQVGEVGDVDSSRL